MFILLRHSNNQDNQPVPCRESPSGPDPDVGTSYKSGLEPRENILARNP